jgi:hypothetical protein
MPRTPRRTWVEDLREYFHELGGEAHYSDLYRHIALNPRRPLGKSWQAVVRRTIEEHSSDSTIWHKRALPDLFRSVSGLGAGRWALRDSNGGRNHLILRSNTDSSWNDTDGESYHFGRTVSNWTKVLPGSEALVERIAGGKHYLIGKATIGAVLPESTDRFIARYDSYENFGEPIPIPQGAAASISALAGHNPQHSISVIPEDQFGALLKDIDETKTTRVTIEQITSPAYERGGNEQPHRRPIGDRPPRPSTKELAKSDPEARRQALERRQVGHHNLVISFRDANLRNGVDVDCTQYADALAASWIFEMKTIEHDAIAQIRAAIGQLYHYLFLHRYEPGYEAASLCIVLDKEIDQELIFFLVAKVNISVIWFEGGEFKGAGAILHAFPALFA